MTNLECTVTNCLHNCDCRCCKQTIVVDGQGIWIRRIVRRLWRF